jgi:hypothetical protein
MFDTFNGLPLHALVVHVVVVLLPLSALCAILIAVVPRWRQRFGIPVALLTIVAVASVPVATHSGQNLLLRRNQTFGPGDDAEAGLMDQHSKLGVQLLPWALVLGIAVIILVGVPLVLRQPTDSFGRQSTLMRGIGVVAAVAVLVGAVGSTVMVYRIGDKGAHAVWQKTITNSKAP